MVRQRFAQIVAEVPAHGDAVGDHAYELAFRAQTLEEHNELELEEDHRVHRGSAAPGVKRCDEFPYEREVEPFFQAPVEVVLRDQLLERDVGRKRGEAADLRAHHGALRPPAAVRDGRPCYPRRLQRVSGARDQRRPGAAPPGRPPRRSARAERPGSLRLRAHPSRLLDGRREARRGTWPLEGAGGMPVERYRGEFEAHSALGPCAAARRRVESQEEQKHPGFAGRRGVFGKGTRTLRKSFLAAATVALVLAVSSPAPAQEEGQEVPASGHGATGHGPYGYSEPPTPDGPAPCQYEPGCDDPPKDPTQYVPPTEEPAFAPPTLGDGQEDAPDLGDGDAPVEAASGDPDDAAALNGAIEAARADRAGGVPPAAASEPAGDEGQSEADVEEGASGGEAGTSRESGGPKIRELPNTSGALPLVLLGTGSVLLLGAGLLLRRVVR